MTPSCVPGICMPITRARSCSSKMRCTARPWLSRVGSPSTCWASFREKLVGKLAAASARSYSVPLTRCPKRRPAGPSSSSLRSIDFPTGRIPSTKASPKLNAFSFASRSAKARVPGVSSKSICVSTALGSAAGGTISDGSSVLTSSSSCAMSAPMNKMAPEATALSVRACGGLELVDVGQLPAFKTKDGPASSL